jgi:EmrB/QacA subfamily drug resistance transporter
MEIQQTPIKQNFFRKWGSLFVLGLALAIIIIDTTLLNVSLGTIIREFHTDIQSIQWVITAYSLTLAALTITGGRIGDLFGRKRMFMVGAIIFAVGSFIASISSSVPTLLIGESLIEGFGAALMMPATASLLVANFKGKDRGIAFGVWGGIAGAASAIGPILGGYLTNNFSWRWGFRINVFVVLLLLATSFVISESRDQEHNANLDFLGIVLSSLGLLGIVFGIIQSSSYGWLIPLNSPTLWGVTIEPFGYSIVPFSIIFGTLALILFFIWENFIEKRGKTPLVSLSIFKNRTFTSGVITTSIVSLGQVGLIFALPVFLQSVLQLDAFHTGLAMLPLSLALLVMAPLSGILSNKVPAKYIVILGLIIDVIAMLVIRSSISVTATVGSLAPGLILFGMGMGMVMAQISNLTLSSVPIQQAGEASGVNNTFRQIGSSLGSAVIGAALLTALSTNLSSGISASRVIPEPLKLQFSQLVSRQTSNVEFGGGAKLDTRIPQSIVTEISSISKQATVDSAKTAMTYASLFAGLGIISALFLPKKKKEQAPNASPNSGH